ncbi:MAG: hypothetical protein U0Q16_01755 [Bryobacteraceae bacterium]
MTPSLSGSGISEPARVIPADEGLAESEFWSLTNRRLTAMMFVGVVAISLVATTIYLVGRLGGARTPTVQSAAPVPQPARASKLATVAPKPAAPSSSPVAPSPLAPAATVPGPVVATAGAALVPPAILSAPAAVQPAPPAGQAFLQVTATEFPMAAKVVEQLSQSSLPARIVEGPSPQIVRVIVGPISDAARSDAWKKEIEKLGFKPFPKKY